MKDINDNQKGFKRPQITESQRRRLMNKDIKKLSKEDWKIIYEVSSYLLKSGIHENLLGTIKPSKKKAQQQENTDTTEE